MKTWLNNTKQKISDWYHDGDNWYLRQIVEPFRELGREVAGLAEPLAETFTPVYSDVAVAEDVMNMGIQDFQDGHYGKGVLKVVGSPFLGAAMLAVPDGMDSPVKAAVKTRKVIRPGAKKAADFVEDGVEYTSYASSQPGTPLHFAVPKSEVTRGKPQWIPTLEEVAEAIAKHTQSAKQVASEGVRRTADKVAGYKATIQRLDRKWARKKDPSDRVRGNYQKSPQPISIKPEFNQNMAQHCASTFTYMDKVPAGQDPILFNYQRWVQHVGREFDTKTKGSLREIEKAFNQIYGHRFKKQGGTLNYATYFK